MAPGSERYSYWKRAVNPSPSVPMRTRPIRGRWATPPSHGAKCRQSRCRCQRPAPSPTSIQARSSRTPRNLLRNGENWSATHRAPAPCADAARRAVIGIAVAFRAIGDTFLIVFIGILLALVFEYPVRFVMAPTPSRPSSASRAASSPSSSSASRSSSLPLPAQRHREPEALARERAHAGRGRSLAGSVGARHDLDLSLGDRSLSSSPPSPGPSRG